MVLGTESKKVTLTSTQRDIYLAQLRYPTSPLYNIGGYIRFSAVDASRVQRAHAYMVAHHDAFGIRIKSDSDEIYQYITDERDTSLPIIDFSHRQDDEADAWLNQVFQTPIYIDDKPLFRSYLMKLPNNRYRYVSLAHHIAVDGWGFANLARLVGVYYNQDAHGQYCAEEEICWHDISTRDQDYIHGKKYEKDQSYWQEYLKGVATDRLLTPDLGFSGDNLANIPSHREIRVIPVDKVIALKMRAAELGIAFSQLLLTMYGLYWAKTYRQQEIVLGVPVHNRSGHGQKSKLGVFTSMSPLRFTIEPNDTFAALANRVGVQIKRNFRHTQFPIGDIYRCIDRSAQSAPLYEVAFNFLHLNSSIEVEDHVADLVYLTHGHEQTPAMLNVWEYGSSNYVELQLDHNLRWFSKAAAERIVDGMLVMLDQVLDTASIPVEQMTSFGTAEQTLLAQVAHIEPLSSRLPGRNIVEAFEFHADRSPNTIAAFHRNGQVSYGTLNQKANQFARLLHSEGVKAGEIVGVGADRDPDLLVALLALFKLGAAYVALSPALPLRRLESIIADSGVSRIIVSESGMQQYPDACETIHMNPLELNKFDGTNLDAVIETPDLAYVIYTSGSTGIPKGVEICHANMMAMLCWAAGEFSEQELRCILAGTSLSFDLSVFELFLPLASGNSVFVVENVLEAVELRPKVSMINTVPSAMRALLEHRCIPDSVIAINLAGEPLPMALLNDIFKQSAGHIVRNLYGPSEDTTYSTCMAYRGPIDQLPAIGKVIEGSCAVVLDPAGNPAPIGHIGELYLGGAGVARGYRNLPELTAERFVSLQLFSDVPVVWYRTGDLVRLDDAGVLHFIGRADEQIKLNGFRIETSEVAMELSRHPQVRDAVVMVKEMGEQRVLVAYFTAKNRVSEDDLSAFVRHSLPSYMIPKHYICLEQFPLNGNGKIDKAQLPEIDVREAIHAFVARNELEAMLLEQWRQLLGVSSIGKDQSLFELGGSSILAMRLVAAINRKCDVKLTLADIFTHDTLSAQAMILAKAKLLGSNEIKVCAPEKAPLSFAQKRIWYTEQLSGQQNLYNMVLSFKLSGPLDLDALNAALVGLVERNSILRTTYHLDHENPYQYVNESMPMALAVETMPTGDSKEVLETLYRQHLAHRFDLSTATLLKASVYLAENGPGYLFISSHHIALDGWSVKLLFNELSELYNSNERRLLGVTNPGDNRFEYRDYAFWQQSQVYEQDVQYWQSKLQGAPKLHGLMLDHPRSNQKAVEGSCLNAFVDPDTTKDLMALCEQWKVTPFTVLFGLFSYLVCVFSRQNDVVVGVPVLGRNHPQLEQMLGVFINTLPIRCRYEHNLTFQQWFERLQQGLLSALDHQELSFDQLVEHLELSHDFSYTPVFQLLFNYQEFSFDGLSLQGIEVERLVHQTSAVKYDVELHINKHDQGLEINWLYNSAIFERKSVIQWQRSYMLLLKELLKEPNSDFNDISVLDPDAGHVLTLWNKNQDTKGARYDEDFITRIFDNLESLQTKPAFMTDTCSVSYQQVALLTQSLVRYMSENGVSSKDRIGIMLKRGVHLQCAMLAAMRLGVTFIPLPHDFTDTRLEYIVQDSQIDFLITDDVARTGMLAGDFVFLDMASTSVDNIGSDCSLPRTFSPDCVAYILYTSGSTGNPKGVPIHYAALDNFLKAMLWRLDLTQSQNWLALTTHSFDISLLEWLAPLMRGDRCILVNELQASDPSLIMDLIACHHIDLVQATPSRWRQLIESGWMGSEELVVLCGGEALDADLQQKLSVRCGSLFNCYGPTEATIWSCVNKIVPHEVLSRRLSLGKSLNNYVHIVVDESGRILPPGAIGELAIGGVSVTKHYHNLPQLTEKRFFTCVQQPYHGERFYLTGDLVCLNNDGDLLYLGRIDGQIKIRGTLVEPAEVQGALCALPQIIQAHVCAVAGDQEPVLAAYLVVNTPVTPIAIRQALQNVLPAYLIPTLYEFVDFMPLNHSGKVDTKALPKASSPMKDEPVRAAGSVQNVLATMWSEQLNLSVEQVCVESDFYTLGGNSLHAVRLVRRINQHFTSLELTVADFLADTRIAAIAELLEERAFYQDVTSGREQFSNTIVL